MRVSENVEKLEPLFPVSGNVKLLSKQYGGWSET